MAAVAIAACIPEEQVLRTWVGAPKDKLVSIWGAPSQAFSMDHGIQVLVYQKPAGEDTPGFDPDSGLIIPAAGPGATCETTFVIDAGRVMSYMTSGNGC